MATNGQFYWPSVGNFVAAYGQFFMAADSQGGPAGVHRISAEALAPVLVHQPAGTSQQGDQTSHRRRRVFLNPAALLRLAGAVLVEQHDEWEAADRRYFSEASMRELEAMNNPTKEVEVMPEITAA